MLDLSPLGLGEPPFSLSPDPRYFYMSLQHRATLAKTTYAIEQRQGISVIFGDVGAGKTTIARRLFQIYRDRPDYETAYIPMPLYPSEFQFLKGICAEFGIQPKRSKISQLAAFQQFLNDVYRKERNALLIIDEAQILIGPQFELLRQILNYETNTEKLIQIILLGQNELRNKLRPKRALSSRMATRSTIEPLHYEDTAAMINFRVMVAGRPDPLFTDEAIRKIYDYSKGMPRDICVVGLNALPLAIVKKANMIDVDIVDEAIREMR
ncbi:MAG: AAA family ATPase [Aliifodinibius sp.]|nr:AAA family ATPase [Fodinibius sp.]NIV13337.1 AAA family ATPase [Fodinibius sp.]NIY27043.1 AAA family ATPase [Fodinibius sp.]